MNQLTGTIVDIQSSDYISLINVDVHGDIFSSIILEGKKGPLNYQKGEQVVVIFKETEVGIAKDLSGLISLRNRMKGRIEKVDKEQILSRIILNYRGRRIEAVISTRSTEQMGLSEGDAVEWLVKTNEVTLMKIPS